MNRNDDLSGYTPRKDDQPSPPPAQPQSPETDGQQAESSLGQEVGLESENYDGAPKQQDIDEVDLPPISDIEWEQSGEFPLKSEYTPEPMPLFDEHFPIDGSESHTTDRGFTPPPPAEQTRDGRQTEEQPFFAEKEQGQSQTDESGYGQFYRPPYRENTQYKWEFNEYKMAEDMAQSSRKKGGALRVFGWLVTTTLMLGLFVLAGYGVYYLVVGPQTIVDAPTPSATPQTSSPELVIITPPSSESTSTVTPDGTTPLSNRDIVELAKPSVVGIEAYSSGSYFPTNMGTGIIMDAEGYIITNAHVVEGSSGLNIILSNMENYTAKLIGLDTKTDIAVLKIEAEGLSPALFGDSSQLRDGDKVLAIGNPGGMELAGTITEGVVSAANRPFKSDGVYSTNYIQTDAAINPGNSGGPLINEYGQVVGITTGKVVHEEFEGLGFAIPINDAKPIIDALIKDGVIKGRPKLGITGQEIDELTSLNNAIPMGIYIHAIEPQSDLAGKNVLRGDIITSVNGVTIHTFDDMSAVLSDFFPGDTVKLTLFRPRGDGVNGLTYEIDVVLLEDLT